MTSPSILDLEAGEPGFVQSNPSADKLPSDSLKRFGNNFITMRDNLESAENTIKKKWTFSTVAHLSLANDSLLEIINDANSIPDMRKRNDYLVLADSASDMFFGYSRRISNIYCKERMIR